jgi:Ala-tRNA(Pro) deacylase
MRVARNVQLGLLEAHCEFDIVAHPHSVTSRETARVAGISSTRMAKSVLIDDRHGHYLLALLPASQHLDLRKVGGPEQWRLTNESTIAALFNDCEPGAVPGLGEPYGLEMLLDPQLIQQPEIYLEAGDHTNLLHMRMEQFRKLVPHAKVCDLCEVRY